jgi:hypothetical protein
MAGKSFMPDSALPRLLALMLPSLLMSTRVKEYSVSLPV